MTKSYAASVYSQKSTTSAKSGRSFLSFTQGATIWPIFTMAKDDDSSPESLDEAKQGIWKSLKNWMPAKKVDDDAITIKSSSDSIASSSNSSLRKWKKLLASPTQYIARHREGNILDKKLSTTSSSQCIDPTTTTSSIDTTSLSDKAPSSSSSYHHHHLPGGILVNAGAGSAQDIAEQNRRRKQRRLYLMRVQQCSSHRHSFSSVGTIDNFNTASGSVNNNCGRKRQVGFSDSGDYSSSSTLLSTPPDSSPKMMDKLDGDDIATTTTTTTEFSYPAPRVMFVEPSPVPRFRNEPPAPPPSPPYLNVIVQPFDFTTSATTTAANENDNDEHQQQHDLVKQHSLIADNGHSEIPTIFTTLPQQFDHNEQQLLQQQFPSSSQVLNQYEHRRPRLIFTSPLQRGQTIAFSLQNTIPDDHIIIYKFLTSNCKLFPRQRNHNSSSSTSTTSTKETMGLSSSSSSWSTSSIFMSGAPKTTSSASSSLPSSANTERYFVRPSAGKMGAGEAHSDIMLFLNQVPPLAPGEILKDKILVRWAVIQRGTQVEAWTQQLTDSTRRKWLEMLLEKWPDQVVERKTRISIRFV